MLIIINYAPIIYYLNKCLYTTYNLSIQLYTQKNYYLPYKSENLWHVFYRKCIISHHISNAPQHTHKNFIFMYFFNNFSHNISAREVEAQLNIYMNESVEAWDGVKKYIYFSIQNYFLCDSFYEYIKWNFLLSYYYFKKIIFVCVCVCVSVYMLM